MASAGKKAAKPTELARSISPTEDREASSMNTDEVALPDLFAKIKNELKDHHKDKNLVLSIPIWGWTGDGKTVAMLTVVHFMSFIEHGVGLTLVSNTAQLHQMESESEIYRGLNLVATAEATTQRFIPLAERFIDNAEWPPGTDEATPYLFEVRTLKGPAAYLLMPDIRGGSYRESDAQAREVLRSAHAAIVLVKPTAFVAKSVEGKRYRDAVTGRIQEALAEGIPTAILITQSDLCLDSGSPADEAHTLLTVLLGDTDPTQRCIARVSVIGASADSEVQQRHPSDGVPPKLPPAELRKPDQLVRAFAWLLWKTLMRPRGDLHQVIPPVSLQSSVGTPTTVAPVLLPEMRRVGEYSGSPGTLVAAWAPDPKSTSFIFLTNKGDLITASLGTDATEPRLAKCGRLDGADEKVTDVTAFLSSGILTIGASTNADFLWHGTKGGDLKKTSLPMTLARWTSIEQNLIAGIDASGTGRLSTFRLDNDHWTQVAHVGEFIPHTELLALAFLERRGIIVALNGDRVEAIQIKSDGSLGERVAPPFHLKYDTPSVTCNSVGIACATLANGQFIVSLSEKPVAVGAALDTNRSRFALASQSPVVAVVQPDSRLIVARVGRLGVKQTQASYSPVLSAPPLSIQWSPNGSLLAVTFEAGTWAAFRPFGLGQG